MWSGFQSNAFQDNAFQIVPSGITPPPPIPTVAYGGWPGGREQHELELKAYQKRMLLGIEAKIVEPTAPVVVIPPPRDERLIRNIAVIRQLRAEMAQTEDTKRRRELRQQIEVARAEKTRLFALEALEDEADAEFILFN